MLKLTYLALFVAILFLSSCRKEQPVADLPIDNPCDCATEVSAEFEIGEITSLIFHSDTTLTDTIFHDKNVFFNALEENAEYTWYIGTEILNTKNVTRYFPSSLSGTNQMISLVVKKKPNLYCNPNDDGYDSVSKPLHISIYPIYSGDSVYLGSIEGVFRMKMPHILDSVDVTINVSKGPGGSLFFYIYNYDGYGSNCENYAQYSGGNYRLVTTYDGTGVLACDYLQGYVVNRMDGVAKMEFSFGSNNPGDSNYFKRTYLGRKLY